MSAIGVNLLNGRTDPCLQQCPLVTFEGFLRSELGRTSILYDAACTANIQLSLRNTINQCRLSATSSRVADTASWSIPSTRPAPAL
jgi:hypothetical protein